MRGMDSQECVAAHLVCRDCGLTKPLSEFYFAKKQNIYIKRCKPCYSVASKARYEKNKDKILSQQKARVAANKEAVSAYMREWYKKNKEHVLARSAAYRADPVVAERETERQKRYYAERADIIQAKRKAAMTPERYEAHKAAWSAWARRNRPLVVAKSRTRRLRIIGATPRWVDLDAINAFYIEAAKLTVETGVPHEVDHIVPIDGKIVSGLHVPWNLQILTRTQNRSKANKLKAEDIVRHSVETRRDGDKEPHQN